jgi:hypothetical protein
MAYVSAVCLDLEIAFAKDSLGVMFSAKTVVEKLAIIANIKCLAGAVNILPSSLYATNFAIYFGERN